MKNYEVYLHKTVNGRVEVIAESFAEAEKSALMADDVLWEDDEDHRELDQITRQD
jgi:hypothetical protein